MTARFIFIILVMLVCATSFSQNYYPFPDSNATWCDESIWNGGLDDVYYYKYYQTDGKININDTLYTIISDNAEEINFYLREASKKVYCRFSPGSPEFLLYDFDIETGDTILYGWDNLPGYVMSSDSLLIGADYHKRYEIWFFDGAFQGHFIEGVGSDLGLMYPDVLAFDIKGDLFCFSMADTIYKIDGSGGTYPGNCWIYLEIPENNKIQMDIYPNPSSDKIFINYDKECNIELVDIFGSVVRKSETKSMDIHDLIKGIYILNIYSETGLLLNRAKIIR
jgi:hypothetical protein